MPSIDIVVQTETSKSVRAKQVSAAFDVPFTSKSELKWKVNFPYDEIPWNVGAIVGPSGSGKSTVMKKVFGEPKPFEWKAASVVDDFAPEFSVQQITEACSAVGFNTIPAWLRPFPVLSNGEKFRVELARSLLELPDPIVVDEFTSLVDRQVGQIGSHAVQKHVRRANKKFVAVTCHYDVIDWLQPDWVLDMATCSFTRRALQRRPSLDCVVGRVPYSAWRMFAPFHYMTASLHKAARCIGLWANGTLAAFVGLLHRPHPTATNIYGVSRVVTLPDWQGMGLAMILMDRVGAMLRASRRRLRTYPAHPSLIRQFNKSNSWRMEKKPGFGTSATKLNLGQRPCGVFEYVGAPFEDAKEASFVLGF